MLILKVTYELKTRWKACFPIFDSNRKRHPSQGREGRATIPPPALPFRILQHVLRWKKRKQNPERQTGHSDQLHCMSFSRRLSHFITVYDSVLLCLRAIQMLMVLAAEQWKKIPGVVTGRASIWSGEPSLGSSFQQDGQLLGGSHAVCAHSGSYHTWQIQITSLFYANNIQPGKKKVAGNSQGQRNYSFESV